MTIRTISSGQTVQGSTVSDGSTEIVRSGGSAVDTTVLSGGTFIFAGGTVTDLLVQSGGKEDVTSAPTVDALTISIGVRAVIGDGGAVSGGGIKSGASIVVLGASGGPSR